jgi:hypothetical protein
MATFDSRKIRRSLRRRKTRLIRWLEPQPIGPILLPLLRLIWAVVKSLAELLLGVTILGLFLLMTPIALPMAIWQLQEDDRRRFRDARGYPCSRCGKPLGERSLELADAVWAETIDRLNRWEQERPGRYHRIRTIAAICPHCDQPHHYDPKTRQFRADASNSPP